MSDLLYFEYALVLPEEHYLIEVQTRKPGGEVRGQAEIEGIAKECLALVIGKGHDDQIKDLRPSGMSHEFVRDGRDRARLPALQSDRSSSGSSQPFDASEPGSRDFTFVLSPSRDYFEPRVLDASDLPAILEEGSDVLLGEPARPWERSVLTETHQPIEAGRTKHGVDATDQQFHILVGEYV